MPFTSNLTLTEYVPTFVASGANDRVEVEEVFVIVINAGIVADVNESTDQVKIMSE